MAADALHAARRSAAVGVRAENDGHPPTPAALIEAEYAPRAPPAMIHWSVNDWRTVTDSATRDTGLGVHIADLPALLGSDRRIRFTSLWWTSAAEGRLRGRAGLMIRCGTAGERARFVRGRTSWRFQSTARRGQSPHGHAGLVRRRARSRMAGDLAR